MNISIKSKGCRLINSKLLAPHEHAKNAYEYYTKREKQFQLGILPEKIKDMFLNINNIIVVKEKEDTYFRMISGWKYAELINKTDKKIHVMTINDELSEEQIKYISWANVLDELLSSWNHKSMFSECVKLFEEIPSELYDLLNSTLKKKTPKALTKFLSSETIDIIRYQVRKVKNENNKEAESRSSLNDNESIKAKMINKYTE